MTGLDDLFGEAPYGLVHLDARLRFVWANEAFVARTGLDSAELYGRTFAEVFPDLDQDAERVAHAILRGDESSAEHLVRVPSRSDLSTTYAFHLVVHPLRFPDGSRGISVLVTEATDEVEAGARLAIATERLHLLSDLGGQMSATFDVDRIVELTAELLLPVLGDACAVDVLEDDDPLVRRVTRASSVHDGITTLSDHGPATSAAHLTPPPPVARVLRSGGMLRFPDVPAGLVDESAEDRVGATVVVPMRARGQIVGAVSLARFGASRGYEPDEIAFAVEAAGRIGVALDNARLFATQRDMASTLQHALLPQRLPQLPGVEVAARYIAGTAGTEVGGDWFDVMPLPDGTIGLVIGDVMGRGVRAAAVMGQLRAAVRAYALLNLAPGRLLRHLDQVVESLDDVQLVTCLYGILDPRTGAFRYAKAGHHPPVLRGPDGYVATLESPSAPPLGLLEMLDDGPVEYATLVPRGATLLLYTDGLVEERAIDPDVRHEQLTKGLSAAGGTPERMVDAVLAAMGRTGAHHDDIALLAVHLADTVDPHDAPAGEAHFTVTSAPASVSAARHLLADVLASWGLAPLRDTATLLVSETVTNALLHARSSADVRVHRTADGIEVEVRDLDARLPSFRDVDDDAETGRGLQLLDELSVAWGAEPSPSGKCVWFRLALPRDR